MALSDTIFDARDEIKMFLETRPGAYGKLEPRLRRLVAEMDELYEILNQPPKTHAIDTRPWGDRQ